MSAPIEDSARATCLNDQMGARHDSMFSPGYLEGPESPRTPEEAIALVDQEVGIVDAKSGVYKEDITYSRVGEASRSAGHLESRTYVGRSWNGRPRMIHGLVGGIAGGGWGASSTEICTDAK